MKLKSLHDQIASKCIHFNGIMNDTCEAGMSYDKIDADHRIPYRKALPCFKDAPPCGTKCYCPKVEFPTEASVKREVQEWDEQMKKMDAALVVVEPLREKYKGQNYSGVIECPVCKGKLSIRHAAYNGHIHAHCFTKDCVSWME